MSSAVPAAPRHGPGSGSPGVNPRGTGRFAVNASHELRTQLAATQAVLDMALAVAIELPLYLSAPRD